MEIEIAKTLELDEAQERLLSMHSVYNVLTVILNQVSQVGALAGDFRLIAPVAEVLQELRQGLADNAATLTQLRRVREIRAAIVGTLATLAPVIPAAQVDRYQRHLDNLESVFNIVEVRAVELLERADDPQRWEVFTVERLATNLRHVFAAIAQNSFGRYRVVFSAEGRAPDTYLMDFQFEALDGRRIHMPSVFEDVIRDLAANGRKYSDPGRTVTVRMVETEATLRLEVTDDGWGIPEAEIADVVDFGRRASNVGDREQPGAGFGLTKAYAVTRIFGGRMWIRSAPGEGTRVTVEIPRRAPTTKYRVRSSTLDG